jgi:hypothetical protein
MFFWNRVEIYNGYSLKDFSELRNSLADAGIRYDYKLVYRNRQRDRNIINVSIGNKAKINEIYTQYYLYVHQKDYYEAMHLTSNRHI